MAGENHGRIVRDRAAQIVRNARAERINWGDTGGAQLLTELVEKINAIRIGEN